VIKVSRNFAEKMLSIYDLFRNLPLSIIFVDTGFQWRNNGIEVRFEEERNGHSIPS